MRFEIQRSDIGKSFEAAAAVFLAAAKCSAMDQTILLKARNAASSCAYVWISGRSLSLEDFNIGRGVFATAIAAVQQLMSLELEAVGFADEVAPGLVAYMPLRLEKPSGLSIHEAALSDDLIPWNTYGTMAALSELRTRWMIYSVAMLPVVEPSRPSEGGVGEFVSLLNHRRTRR